MTTSTRCVGCLGSGACWVCDGSGRATGLAPTTHSSGRCQRCGGSGVCSFCSPEPEASQDGEGERGRGDGTSPTER